VDSTPPPADPVPTELALPREHGSPFVRGLFLVTGALAFALGVAGVFLPLLPATPLLILAAACFARAYRPFHEWMLDHRWIGPPLREWYAHRSLRAGTKWVAIVTMLVSFTVSIVFFVRPGWLKAALAVFALCLAAWLYRIPSRPPSIDR
jgi:uncharacterized membrane protein YbaN (DUF454 family)